MRHLVIIAIMVLSTTIACGELGKPQSATGVTITLTDSNCTADGVGALLQDDFTASLVNKTASMAFFNFQRVQDGHTYAELDSYIHARARGISAGVEQDIVCCPPPMTTSWATRFVGPGQQDKFDVQLPAGTYGLVCRRDSLKGPRAEAIYVLGPFRVV